MEIPLNCQLSIVNCQLKLAYADFYGFFTIDADDCDTCRYADCSVVRSKNFVCNDLAEDSRNYYVLAGGVLDVDAPS